MSMAALKSSRISTQSLGARYTKIEDSEDSLPMNYPRDFSTARPKVGSLTRFNALFFGLNITMLIAAISLLQKSDDANWLLTKTNTYSPVFDSFKFRIRDDTYNASFFNSPYSIYRGDPSPEVDAAWEAIEYPAQMHFSREEILRLGKDPEAAVKLPEEWGYGKDRYFGVLDGQHLIHCLNLLRQWSHFDYYFPKYTPQSRAPPLASAHKDHCVSVLLQHLTCQPSLNIFTYYWMESQPEPYPNFEIDRKCQNHDDLLQWQVEREIAAEHRDLVIHRPQGTKFRPADPQLSKIEGWIWNGSAPL